MITDKNHSPRVWVGQPKGVSTQLFSVVSPKHGDYFFSI